MTAKCLLRRQAVWLLVSLVCLLGSDRTRANDDSDDSILNESPITESDRDHWAFQPLRRPPLPVLPSDGSASNGVDAFIRTGLQKKGLDLAPEADRATLLRRLSFDLIGLPPTPEAWIEFENDGAPDAYERLVDRLLASPAYGERWAQHWLDLARYAETDGFEHDKVRPESWKYRDWVIEALNADLAYDQFVAAQLAGDELASAQERHPLGSRLAGKTATTFCLAGPDMPDHDDQSLRRHELLNDLTSTVGSALLGLQMGCAQCHDHKYDPISQADFYRLRAVFEPAVPVLKRDQLCDVLAAQRGVPEARLWIRGDHRRPGPVVQPGFPRIAEWDADQIGSEAAAKERASRLRLAEWIFNEKNPLPARVMANRVWQHHFGRGIFDTPSDVGLINAGPTHPELLDWLAVELKDSGWSLKHLHRAIVLSGTYRQTSREMESAATDWQQRLAADPANALYSRFPRRRLDGESLRDAMLAAAGLLSTERGGAGVMPPLPDELTSTLLKGQWSASKREADHYKRSVYLFARRNLRYPIFEAFDRPDANASCAVRSHSTTAPQSLMLLNSEFSLSAARHLSARLLASGETSEGRVERLYLLTLGRRPSTGEVETVSTFLVKQRERLVAEQPSGDSVVGTDPHESVSNPLAEAALVDACLAILNSSEFVYID